MGREGVGIEFDTNRKECIHRLEMYINRVVDHLIRIQTYHTAQCFLQSDIMLSDEISPLPLKLVVLGLDKDEDDVPCLQPWALVSFACENNLLAMLHSWVHVYLFGGLVRVDK